MTPHNINLRSFILEKKSGVHSIDSRADMNYVAREQFLPHPEIEPLLFCLPARCLVTVTTPRS
jgi:hypothetical protein